ncbi:hypothetical protein POM88_039464 [Heracleum sosnowskyi]|uniref:START domain-containing protein n=1 Tax=Heracleum sosnowskyi TaxID=360622 RepID=A0AAD8M9C9_9APIA|nr:hypothetical protein POM88_039464 [Heracleum sosnowskyi]
MSKVGCKTKRIGGGFGGKETMSAFFADVADVPSYLFNGPVKVTLDRDVDMMTTGHRHSFLGNYKFRKFRKKKKETSLLHNKTDCNEYLSRSWSIPDDSLRRYVHFASENCIQELLSTSDCNKVGNGNDGWKLVTFDNGVEISKRRSGSFDTFRSRWLLRSVSPQQFIIVANSIDPAKQWDTDLVEASYIKALEDNLSII